MLLNLDYTLGWFLAALYTANDLKDRLRFKGGTCLRKVYFSQHRFSEDLDFTATITVNTRRLRPWVEQAAHAIQGGERDEGIRFGAQGRNERNPEGAANVDSAVDGERIAAIGLDLSGRSEIDASRKLVLTLSKTLPSAISLANSSTIC